MDVDRDTAALTLASVNLHIGSIVPSPSLTSYEDQKNKTLASRTSRTSSAASNHSAMPTPPTSSSESLSKTAAVNARERRSSSQLDSSWTQLQVKDRMAWTTSFKMNKKGGLVFLDHETLKKQQGVFKEVMLQVGSQLLSGKLAVRISLPIRIFEPRTLLERVADGWNYAPTLLKKAALSSEPIERMKYVIAFVTGGFHFCVGQQKPFNPILGETYEATYADGTQVFLEHVSHHPVKSAFTISGPKALYTVSGVYEFESSTSRNSIVNHQVGTAKVVFHDGHTITYTVPQIKMSGILIGERVVELTGTASFVDAAHHLIGEVNFDANNSFLMKSHAEDIKGTIHPAKKSAKHALSTVQGSWLSHLQFDNKVYWHVESEPVFEHQPVANPLPSDSRFREDVIALKNGDLALAQSEKLRLEELQRADKKLREEKQNAV
uniref:Oxysterol-binding protein n=1 Tax=Globisporangium ultimum (strain ATCC 200006 / CBS 805.95 / DAOM BR144) TaxID=431595 RepID=K3WHK9_GLOUD